VDDYEKLTREEMIAMLVSQGKLLDQQRKWLHEKVEHLHFRGAWATEVMGENRRLRRGIREMAAQLGELAAIDDLHELRDVLKRRRNRP
jgi:hypothetical protein